MAKVAKLSQEHVLCPLNPVLTLAHKPPELTPLEPENILILRFYYQLKGI